MNKDKSDEIEILTDSPVTDNKINPTEEILTDIPVSNGANNNIEIKKTATIKSESGTSVIGEISGDTITATNNPLPDKIDINSKPKVVNK